jgi:tetratricopeptide (TPR) repeat protein
MKATSLTALAVAVVFPLAAACGPSKPPGTVVGPDAVPSSSASSPTAATPGIDEAGAAKDVDDGKRAFDAGDLPGAQKAYESALAKMPNNYLALFGVGMVHEKSARKPQAMEAYKQALNVKPDGEEAGIQLAAMYLDANPQRLDDAIAVCRSVLALKPKNATLHNTLAIALAYRGFDHEAALKEFEEALRLNVNEPMFHITYAEWLTAWKEKGAAAHLDMARQLVKDDPALLATIAHELRLAGEFQPCIDIYTKLIAKKDGGEVRTERALCKLGLKDDAGVMADLLAAVAKEAGYAPAHYYLGGRYAVKKKWKEAAAEYEKYLQLEPSGSLAKAATERLEMSKKMLEKK